MNLFILIAMWLALPTVAILFGFLKIRHLDKERLHDAILYNFCTVRDAMALKAASGELDEDSEIFGFFFVKNAELIHIHKSAGVCFHNFARSILGKIARGEKRPLDAQTKRLFRQLRHADDSIKVLAARWIDTAAVMLSVAARGTRVQRAIWKESGAFHLKRIDFYRWLGRQFFVPEEKRAAANLLSGLYSAIGRQLATA